MRRLTGFAPYLLWKALRRFGLAPSRLGRWLASLGYETILLSDIVTVTVTTSAPVSEAARTVRPYVSLAELNADGFTQSSPEFEAALRFFNEGRRQN